MLNIFQADAIGCHVITVTHDLLAKLDTVGKDLDAYSLETVRMFREDAVGAGYTPGQRRAGTRAEGRSPAAAAIAQPN